MRSYFVQERGKKRRHSSVTASIFNEVIGQKSEQIRAIYFVTTPKVSPCTCGFAARCATAGVASRNRLRFP